MQMQPQRFGTVGTWHFQTESSPSFGASVMSRDHCALKSLRDERSTFYTEEVFDLPSNEVMIAFRVSRHNAAFAFGIVPAPSMREGQKIPGESASSGSVGLVARGQVVSLRSSGEQRWVAITSTSIAEHISGFGRCPECHFDICPECLPFGVARCPSGHPLSTAFEKPEGVAEWKCTDCGEYNSADHGSPGQYCKKCGYTKCPRCLLAAIPGVPQTKACCPSRHELTIVMGNPYLARGHWMCDRCRCSIQDDTVAAGHCPLCQYDLCPKCLPRGPIHCPRSHAMQIAKSKPQGYSNWQCSECRRGINANEAALHCPDCKYDLCPSCVTNPFQQESAYSTSERPICPQGHPLSIFHCAPGDSPAETSWYCDRCSRPILGPTVVVLRISYSTLSVYINGAKAKDEELNLAGRMRFAVTCFAANQTVAIITPPIATSLAPSRNFQEHPPLRVQAPGLVDIRSSSPKSSATNGSIVLSEDVLEEDKGWTWVSGNSSTVQDSGATAKSTASDQYAYTPQVVCNRTNEKVRCGGCGKPLWESWWECRQCGSGFAFCNRCFQDTECAQLHQHGRDSFSVNHGGTLFVLALRVVAAKGSGLSFGLIGSSDANFGTNSIVVSSDGGTVHVLVGNQRIQTYGKQRCFNDGDIVELRLQKSTFVLLLNGDLLHKEAASPNTKYRFAVRFHSPQQQVQIQRRAPLKLGLACELACTASQLTAEAGICGMTLKSGNFAAGVVVGFDHDDNSVRVALPDVEGGVWLPHAALRCASNVDPPRLLMPLAKGMTVMRFNDWKWGAVDGGWQNPEQGRVLDASLGKAKVQFRSTTADVRYGRQPDGSLYFDVIACLERGYRVARNVFYWTYGDQDSGQFGRVVTMNGTNVTVRWDNGSEAQYSFGAKGTFDIQRVDDDHSPDPSVPIVPPTPEVIFAKGTSVLLRGLTSHAELNGKSATVQTYDGAAGRYVVVLDDDSTVRVQPQNLMTTTKTNITVNRATNSSNGSAKVPPSPGPATDPKPTVPTDPTPAAFPSGVEVRKDGTILAPIAAVESKKIAREDFDLYNKEKLGSGSFGLVFKGMFAGKPIAIKKINPTQEVDDEILREVLFGSVLSHPNILTISNWSVAPDNDGVSQYYLIMPLVEPGSLRKALDSIATDHGPAKGGKLGWKKFFKVATGVLDALHHLATRPTPVVHRDLKPENILVDKDFFPQVSDFGLAKRLEQTMKMSRKMNASTSGVCGTWSYMSPEALQGQTTKPPTDMYSYGCILWELLHNKIPRDGTQDQINTAVVNRQEPLVISPDVPAPLAELITKSTLWDAQRRLTASNARALLKAEFQKCESGDPLYAEP